MMGKRKRKDDINNTDTPPPSDITPYPPQEALQLEQRSSDQAESSATQPSPSIMDVMGGSPRRPSGHQSLLNHNHNSSSRAMLLRHARHTFGRHYSRRSSASHHDASPSTWNGAPVYDSKLSFKLASKDLADFHFGESREKMFHKPERIRSSSLVVNAASSDSRKLECGICQKRLAKKRIVFENSISSGDLSVVAVLVCGHAFHADCLEQKTSHEDRRDPPCPTCA